jgi:hypothetical protein
MKNDWMRKMTKKEILAYCLRNGYGEVKFNGKKRIMYAKENELPRINNALMMFANRLGYQLEYK